jgi:AraC family transcriptional regulator
MANDGRLVQQHFSLSAARTFSLATQEGFDRSRLSRVLDYIEAHLEDDLTLDQLALIACLSRLHFPFRLK